MKVYELTPWYRQPHCSVGSGHEIGPATSARTPLGEVCGCPPSMGTQEGNMFTFFMVTNETMECVYIYKQWCFNRTKSS
jgi:hypothetical protein